ncbi:MAG: hypothetical protein KA802_08680, partial [Saprospiraceae bacterium]|nr:hypothetical protein [Saprospiraceae bacterium]
LETKKKLFGFPFWFFSMILAFVLGFALVQMSHTSEVPLAEMVQATPPSSDMNAELNGDNTGNKKVEAIIQVHLTDNEDLRNHNSEIDAVNVNTTAKNATRATTIRSGSDQRKIYSSQTFSPSNSKINNTISKATISDHNQQRRDEGSADGHNASTAQDRIENVQTNVATGKNITEPKKLANTTINKEILELSSNTAEDKITKNNTANQSSDIKNARTAVLSPEEVASLSADELEVKDLTLEPFHFPKNVKCPTFSKKRIIPFVQVEVGAGPSMRHLTAEIESSKIYINKLATERPFYVCNASLHAGLILRNNITVHTGINYTMVKDRFDYEKSGLTQILITFDANNNPIDTMIRTGTQIIEGENRFHLINIPVGVGYQKKMGRWMLAGEVGVGVNVSLKTSGKVLYNDNAVHNLDEVDNFYKKSLGLSLNAALAIHYSLGDRTSIYLKPRYDMFMNDWTLKGAGFKASYDLLNVNIGIRRCF